MKAVTVELTVVVPDDETSAGELNSILYQATKHSELSWWLGKVVSVVEHEEEE